MGRVKIRTKKKKMRNGLEQNSKLESYRCIKVVKEVKPNRRTQKSNYAGSSGLAALEINGGSN